MTTERQEHDAELEFADRRIAEIKRVCTTIDDSLTKLTELLDATEADCLTLGFANHMLIRRAPTPQLEANWGDALLLKAATLRGEWWTRLVDAELAIYESVTDR